MKRLLLVLMLIAVAFSGCTEKGPNVADKSAGELKTLSIAAAENLTCYSIKSFVTQILKLDSGANATTEMLTTIKENAETVSVVNLSSLEAYINRSTKNQMEIQGQLVNASSSSFDIYQVGNSTYRKDEGVDWIHLKDPRSSEEIWGQGKNNQVKALAKAFNYSKLEDAGSEAINGEDAYKFKITTLSEEYNDLYNTALNVAAVLVEYPMRMPSVNRTELNKTGMIEKWIWISKKNYLPVKYQNIISFQITPEVIGNLDLKTGQMVPLNQSEQLGEVSVQIEISDMYYDFDKPADITPPEQALFAQVITPTQIQTQAAMQA